MTTRSGRQNTQLRHWLLLLLVVVIVVVAVSLLLKIVYQVERNRIWISWERRSTKCSLSISHTPRRNSAMRATVASFLKFLDHTQWPITFGRTPLNEGSACRRDGHLNNTQHSPQSMPLAWFEPSFPASTRPQILAVDRSATGIGPLSYYYIILHE